MFDILFDLFSALNQFALFVMATSFMVIGGLFIGYELYWRLKSVKIEGRISEVRVSGYKESKHTPEKTIETVEDFKKDRRIKPFGGLIVVLFIGLPLIFSGLGFYMGYSYFSLSTEGAYANAKVIRNDASYDSDSGTSYKAVLEFTDQSGKKWQVKDSISYGNSPSFASGAQVGVFYNPIDPTEFVIDDFWHNMAISLMFIAFGLVFIAIVFLASYFNNKKKNSPRSQKTNYSGEMYHSVFEYRTPEGQNVEQISTMGSNYIIGRMPGTVVDLMVLPDNSQKVRRPTLFWLLFGIIFFLPGVFIMNMALESYNQNYMMTLLLTIGAFYLGYKISSFYQTINNSEFDRSLLAEMWQNFKNDRIKKSNIQPIKGRTLEVSEIIERTRFQLKYSKITGYFFLVIMVALTVGAYYAGQKMIDLSQNGLATSGQVSDISSRLSSDNDGYIYYAEITFIDQEGNQQRFEDSMGASQPLYKIGDTVDVLYPADSPTSAIINRGIFNWLLSGGLLIAALSALRGAVHFFTVKSKYEMI